MLIGIDLDSTINNLETEWFADYNRLYDDCITEEQLTDWNMVHILKQECGTKIFDLLTPDLFARCAPRQDSVEVVQSLSEKHDVVIVTACFPNTFDAKRDWVRKYLPFLHKDNFIGAFRKELVRMDVLIDDGLHNFCYGRNGTKLNIVYDRPWNRVYDTAKWLHIPVRVFNWQEIPAAIKYVE